MFSSTASIMHNLLIMGLWEAGKLYRSRDTKGSVGILFPWTAFSNNYDILLKYRDQMSSVASYLRC